MGIIDALMRIVSGLASLVYLGWLVEAVGAWLGVWQPQHPGQGAIFAMALAAFTSATRWTFFSPT
jgi:Na+/citrate or Na+/malate symporter